MFLNADFFYQTFFVLLCALTHLRFCLLAATSAVLVAKLYQPTHRPFFAPQDFEQPALTLRKQNDETACRRLQPK